MYQLDGACYATPLEAVTSYSANLVGNVVVLGGNSHIVAAVNPGSDGVAVTYQRLNQTTSSTIWVPLNVPECQMMTSVDALSIGWGIAAAWIATYAITFLSRYLIGEMNSDKSDYGHS